MNKSAKVVLGTLGRFASKNTSLPQLRVGPRKGGEAEFITKLVGRIVRECVFVSATDKALSERPIWK